MLFTETIYAIFLFFSCSNISYQCSDGSWVDDKDDCISVEIPKIDSIEFILTKADNLYYAPAETPSNLTNALLLYETACELESTRGCIEWAHKIHQGKGTPKDVSKAKLILTDEILKDADRNCNDKSYKTCARLGTIYDLGIVVDTDQSQAMKYYQIACDGGEMLSCSNLGYVLLHGNEELRDEKIDKN